MAFFKKHPLELFRHMYFEEIVKKKNLLEDLTKGKESLRGINHETLSHLFVILPHYSQTKFTVFLLLI